MIWFPVVIVSCVFSGFVEPWSISHETKKNDHTENGLNEQKEDWETKGKMLFAKEIIPTTTVSMEAIATTVDEINDEDNEANATTLTFIMLNSTDKISVSTYNMNSSTEWALFTTESSMVSAQTELNEKLNFGKEDAVSKTKISSQPVCHATVKNNTSPTKIKHKNVCKSLKSVESKRKVKGVNSQQQEKNKLPISTARIVKREIGKEILDDNMKISRNKFLSNAMNQLHSVIMEENLDLCKKKRENQGRVETTNNFMSEGFWETPMTRIIGTGVDDVKVQFARPLVNNLNSLKDSNFKRLTDFSELNANNEPLEITVNEESIKGVPFSGDSTHSQNQLDQFESAYRKNSKKKLNFYFPETYKREHSKHENKNKKVYTSSHSKESLKKWGRLVGKLQPIWENVDKESWETTTETKNEDQNSDIQQYSIRRSNSNRHSVEPFDSFKTIKELQRDIKKANGNLRTNEKCQQWELFRPDNTAQLTSDNMWETNDLLKLSEENKISMAQSVKNDTILFQEEQKKSNANSQQPFSAGFDGKFGTANKISLGSDVEQNKKIESKILNNHTVNSTQIIHLQKTMAHNEISKANKSHDSLTKDIRDSTAGLPNTECNLFDSQNSWLSEHIGETHRTKPQSQKNLMEEPQSKWELPNLQDTRNSQLKSETSFGENIQGDAIQFKSMDNSDIKNISNTKKALITGYQQNLASTQADPLFVDLHLPQEKCDLQNSPDELLYQKCKTKTFQVPSVGELGTKAITTMLQNQFLKEAAKLQGSKINDSSVIILHLKSNEMNNDSEPVEPESKWDVTGLHSLSKGQREEPKKTCAPNSSLEEISIQPIFELPVKKNYSDEELQPNLRYPVEDLITNGKWVSNSLLDTLNEEPLAINISNRPITNEFIINKDSLVMDNILSPNQELGRDFLISPFNRQISKQNMLSEVCQQMLEPFHQDNSNECFNDSDIKTLSSYISLPNQQSKYENICTPNQTEEQTAANSNLNALQGINQDIFQTNRFFEPATQYSNKITNKQNTTVYGPQVNGRKVSTLFVVENEPHIIGQLCENNNTGLENSNESTSVKKKPNSNLKSIYLLQTESDFNKEASKEGNQTSEVLKNGPQIQHLQTFELEKSDKQVKVCKLENYTNPQDRMNLIKQDRSIENVKLNECDSQSVPVLTASSNQLTSENSNSQFDNAQRFEIPRQENLKFKSLQNNWMPLSKENPSLREIQTHWDMANYVSNPITAESQLHWGHNPLEDLESQRDMSNLQTLAQDPVSKIDSQTQNKVMLKENPEFSKDCRQNLSSNIVKLSNVHARMTGANEKTPLAVDFETLKVDVTKSRPEKSDEEELKSGNDKPSATDLSQIKTNSSTQDALNNKESTRKIASSKLRNPQVNTSQQKSDTISDKSLVIKQKYNKSLNEDKEQNSNLNGKLTENDQKEMFISKAVCLNENKKNQRSGTGKSRLKTGTTDEVNASLRCDSQLTYENPDIDNPEEQNEKTQQNRISKQRKSKLKQILTKTKAHSDNLSREILKASNRNFKNKMVSKTKKRKSVPPINITIAMKNLFNRVSPSDVTVSNSSSLASDGCFKFSIELKDKLNHYSKINHNYICK